MKFNRRYRKDLTQYIKDLKKAKPGEVIWIANTILNRNSNYLKKLHIVGEESK